MTRIIVIQSPLLPDDPRKEGLATVRALVEDHIDLVQQIKRYFDVVRLPDEIKVHIVGLDYRLARLRESGLREVCDE